MSETPSDTSEAGAWLPLADAARVLRRSIRTIDRRGLPKRRDEYGRVVVWVAGATSDDVSPPSETDDRQPPGPEQFAVELAERVSDVVRQQTAPLEADLARARDQIETLARENGRLSERLAMTETVADANRQRLSHEIAHLEQAAAILAEQANERDALAAALARERAVSEANAAERDRERAAREAAEQERNQLKGRSWWERLRNR